MYRVVVESAYTISWATAATAIRYPHPRPRNTHCVYEVRPWMDILRIGDGMRRGPDGSHMRHSLNKLFPAFRFGRLCLLSHNIYLRAAKRLTLCLCKFYQHNSEDDGGTAATVLLFWLMSKYTRYMYMVEFSLQAGRNT